ncbi:MAG: ASCH domain-containing protein [Candidatus Bathyarchaeia archaeon]
MPPLIFKRPLLFLILEGRKTQTRRLKPLWKEGCIYPIMDDYSEGPKGYVRIIRCWQQRLGDITPEEAKAEGFNSLEEFKATWIRLYGFWQPEIFVYAIEFQLIKTAE